MDATAIVDNLDSNAIQSQIADLAAKQRALRVLLRAARARERRADGPPTREVRHGEPAQEAAS